jgi:hypothetical protein
MMIVAPFNVSDPDDEDDKSDLEEDLEDSLFGDDTDEEEK